MSLRRPQKNLRITCPSCEQKLDASDVPAFEEINCPECSCAFTVPFRFGQYLLTEAIEEGEFSGVYRARDLKLRREVAVKILFEALAGDAHIVDLFLGAARRTAILNHINILPIYSCDCRDGSPYIVMEYMAGTCLYRGLEGLDHMVPVTDCLHYCEMAARGLDAAHREGVDHNGMRPTNVLWDETGNIKICDFGMYEFKCACAEKMGVDWRVFFHCGYTSPEILTGDNEGGLAADIFGLGTTLYHLLTGQRPFSNKVEYRMENLSTVPPSPHELRADVPAAVSDFVMRMIAFDPHDRPPAYRDVISTFFMLRGALNEAPQPAKMTGKPHKKFTGSAAHLQAARARQKLAIAGPGKGHKKGRLLLILALVLLLILAIGTGSLVFLAHKGQPVAKKIVAGISRVTKGETGERSGAGAVARSGQGTDDDVTEEVPLIGANVPPAFFFRPVPPGLNFSRDDSQLRQYLRGLPPGLRRQEVSRLEVLAGFRPHVLEMMRALPYAGQGVQLRDGLVVGGAISECDNQGLTVRLESGASKQIGWDELSTRQYKRFLSYYIKKRSDRKTEDAEERTALARDYLMLALVCDWLNEIPQAVKYANEASTTDPETAVKTRVLLPYLPL